MISLILHGASLQDQPLKIIHELLPEVVIYCTFVRDAGKNRYKMK